MSKCDYRCPDCKEIWEVSRSMKDESPILCPSCGSVSFAWFGRMNDIAFNFGFRPDRYSNKVDSDIAKYQFRHL